MTILRGEAVAAEIRENVVDEVRELKADGVEPGLAIVLVGDNPASESYVSRAQEACRDVGIRSFNIRMDEDTGQEEVEEMIVELNGRDAVDGILVQLPLSQHIDRGSVLSKMDPLKDVDGLHPENVGLLASGNPRFEPCTPAGILRILEHYGIEMVDNHAVIVGASEVVGRPLASLFLNRGVSVTVCPEPVPDLGEWTRSADILVVAAGQEGLVDGSMVSDEATVIDAGINMMDAGDGEGYRVVGDVKFDEVASRASHVTPVPGGVGPVTVAMLLENTLEAARMPLPGKGR